jgi:hypothetical protein
LGFTAALLRGAGLFAGPLVEPVPFVEPVPPVAVEGGGVSSFGEIVSGPIGSFTRFGGPASDDGRGAFEFAAARAAAASAASDGETASGRIGSFLLVSAAVSG